jgi:hypothetical protein
MRAIHRSGYRILTVISVKRKGPDESYLFGWDTSVFDLPRPKRVNFPSILVLGAVNDKLLSRDEIEETARVNYAQAEFFQRGT